MLTKEHNITLGNVTAALKTYLEKYAKIDKDESSRFSKLQLLNITRLISLSNRLISVIDHVN